MEKVIFGTQKIVENKTIKLTNAFDKPLQVVPRERPLIGIAVVIPKRV